MLIIKYTPNSQYNHNRYEVISKKDKKIGSILGATKREMNYYLGIYGFKFRW